VGEMGRRPSGRALAIALAVALAAGVLGACQPTASSSTTPPATTAALTPSLTPTPLPTATPTPTPTSMSGIADFPFVWIVVLENKDYERVVGADDLPYLTRLIDRYGLAEASYGVARPSQPNYFALFSGSTHDVTDNDRHDLDAPTIADGIEASGRTWGEYAENRPPGCFTGGSATGGRDGSGEYRRKHAPAISFTSIRSDGRRCGFLQDLTAFRPGDVDYALIIPNQCHSAHDCPLREADAWLSGFVPTILDSDAFRTGGVLFVTFDEAGPGDPNGGHIATIVVSLDVPAGFRSTERHDHYTLLRTIQAAWGLDCLAESCSAGTMDEFFAAR